MAISLIVILGVMGFIIVDLSSINGVIEVSGSSDKGIIRDENQLTQIEKAANKYLYYRQKLWVADNPVIRVGRQVFYIVDLYVNSDGNFLEAYKEVDEKQTEQIKFG